MSGLESEKSVTDLIKDRDALVALRDAIDRRIANIKFVGTSTQHGETIGLKIVTEK